MVSLIRHGVTNFGTISLLSMREPKMLRSKAARSGSVIY